MSRITDKSELADLFKNKCESFSTTGTQEGIVLKFSTFYMKIYDSDKSDNYIIHVYEYGSQNPMFVDEVPSNRMREYAAKFY